MLVHEFLELSAEKFPDKTALVQFFDESKIGKIFGVGVFRRRHALRQIIQDRFERIYPICMINMHTLNLLVGVIRAG